MEMVAIPLLVEQVTVEPVALLEPAIAAPPRQSLGALAAPVELVELEVQQQAELPAMVVLEVWVLRAVPERQAQYSTALKAETVARAEAAVGADLRQLVLQEPVALAATLALAPLVELDLRLPLAPATTEETVAVAATADSEETAVHQLASTDQEAKEVTLGLEALAALEAPRRMAPVARVALADLPAPPATEGLQEVAQAHQAVPVPAEALQLLDQTANASLINFCAVTASLSERSPAHLPTGKCQLTRKSCTVVYAHRTRDAHEESIAN